MTHSPGAHPPSIPVASQRPPTVLVAEGDLVFRERLRAALERRGFIILTAASGRDAITIAAACRSAIELVLTHRNLFGIGGAEVAAAIRSERPHVRVAFLVDRDEDAAGVTEAPVFVKSAEGLDRLVTGVFELAVPVR